MTDLVVGLGEIGMPLYQLLKNRNFKVDGYDPNVQGFNAKALLAQRYDMVHIAIPWSDNFLQITNSYNKFTKNLVIHSTVPTGTSEKIGAIYSPVRGIHNDMLNQLDWFSKYYSGKVNVEFEKRFPKAINAPDSNMLERTKAMQLKYYALLIAFRKWVDKNHPIYWHFMIELHQKFGIFPILYNDHKDIGGHCIRENQWLIEDPLLDKFIRDNGGKL